MAGVMPAGWRLEGVVAGGGGCAWLEGGRLEGGWLEDGWLLAGG